MLIVVIDDPYDRFRFNRQAYEMPVSGGHPPHQFNPVGSLEVRAFNARAIQFYNQHGWKEVRRYPGTECGAPVENIEMSKRF